MAKLRSYLLLTLVLGVLVGWASTDGSSRLLSTWGAMSDAESDTNNTITADQLGAPTLNSATATTATEPGTITLSWTVPSGDPANQIRIWRKSEPCASGGAFSALTTVTETPTTFANTGLDADTYCYRVQGVLHGWTSPFSVTREATISPAVEVRTLKLNSANASTNTLVTGTATGERTISANTNPPFESVTWNTASAVTVTAAQNWTLVLDLNTSNPFESTTLVAQLRVHATSCGTGSGTLIASSSATTLTGDGNITLNAASFTAPVSGVLCLTITNQSSNSGASHAAKIITTGGSTLTGPFDP